MTTSNDGKPTTKPANEHHPSSEVIVKAINYPPRYPDNKSRERCNNKEEKHKNCHLMHCHHIQPMQSATTTTTPSIDNPNHTQQNGSIK
jgi:hypothetical protein